MTVHRWFANKSCPGDYIYSRLGQIANEVNRKLNSTNKSIDTIAREVIKGRLTNSSNTYDALANVQMNSQNPVEARSSLNTYTVPITDKLLAQLSTAWFMDEKHTIETTDISVPVIKADVAITEIRLIDANTKEEIVHKNVRENLDIICSGDIPPNPAELIGSETMDKILDELSEEYEYIFIDSPPICVVTDPSVIASKVSGVVIVALQNSTEKDVIKTAVEQVEFVGAKLLGFVLNGVEYTASGRYKYRYGYRYYHGLRGKHYERSYYYNSAYSRDKKPTANK